MGLKKVTDCPTPTKEEVKGGIKRKTPKIHAAQTRCRCNKIGPSRGESEGSGVFGGQQDKIWLLQQTLAASPHKGEKSADHTSTSKKLPISDTLNRVIVRMALKSERHDSRRTRKGKSTWRWRAQEAERSGISLLPFPLFPDQPNGRIARCGSGLTPWIRSRY